MKRRTLLIIACLIVITTGWYLFRPERLFINERVNEEFPKSASVATSTSPTSPVVLYQGRFHDGAHKSDGLATIYRFADGKRVLRFTSFETSNGPDVRVYLIAADDAKDNVTVTQSGFVELGPLKGNVGDQNYELPYDLDLGKYRAVTIWCKRFSVNFATAPLSEKAS
jgi:electron transfer DM13